MILDGTKLKACLDNLLRHKLFLASSLATILAVIVGTLLWDEPQALRWLFLGTILLGAATAALATFQRFERWILFGAIVSALGGFGANYFGDIVSGTKETKLQNEIIKISKELSLAREDMKVLIATAEISYRSQTLDKEQVQDRLKVIHQRLFDSIPSDAEEWAKRFVELLPIRQEEMHASEQKKRDEHGGQVHRVPVIFSLMLRIFDERINALSTRMEGIRLENLSGLPSELFTTDAKGPPELKIRKVLLPNKRSIEASITYGEYSQGLIRRYPEFHLREFPEPKGYVWPSFGLRAVTLGAGPIPYPLNEDQARMSAFGEQFAKVLDSMLGTMLSKDPI